MGKLFPLARRNNGVFDRVLYEFSITLQAQIFHDVVLVIAYGAMSNPQDIGDLLHRPAFRQHLQDLALALYRRQVHVKEWQRDVERLADAISSAGHKNVVFTSTMQAGMEYMLREARPGDAVLTIGAGSINRVLDQLAMLLGSKVTTSHAD